jgi:hypothetical protein
MSVEQLKAASRKIEEAVKAYERAAGHKDPKPQQAALGSIERTILELGGLVAKLSGRAT